MTAHIPTFCVLMFAPNWKTYNSNSKSRVLKQSMYHQQQLVLFEENMKNSLSLFFTWSVADISACVDIRLFGIAVTIFT